MVTPLATLMPSMHALLYAGSRLMDATAIFTSQYFVANSHSVRHAPGYSPTISPRESAAASPFRRASAQRLGPPFIMPPPLFSWLFRPLPCLHLLSTFTSHRASLIWLVVAFPSTAASPSCRLRPAPRPAIHHASPLCRAHLTQLVVVTRPPPLVAHLSFGWLLHCPAPQPCTDGCCVSCHHAAAFCGPTPLASHS